MSGTPPPVPDPTAGADQLVRDLLAQGSESAVDYKAPMSVPTEKRDRAKLAKHVIGFSNTRDGGYLLIGVDDKSREALGLTPQELETWDGARVANAVSSYAAPEPEVQVFRGKLEDGKELVAIRIVPFADQPLVCIQSVEDGKGGHVIRAGALYVRTGTTETKEVATEAEMRELLQRAYVKMGDQLLGQIKALIDAHWPGPQIPVAEAVLAEIDHDLADLGMP